MLDFVDGWKPENPSEKPLLERRINEFSMEESKWQVILDTSKAKEWELRFSKFEAIENNSWLT